MGLNTDKVVFVFDQTYNLSARTRQKYDQRLRPMSYGFK